MNQVKTVANGYACQDTLAIFLAALSQADAVRAESPLLAVWEQEQVSGEPNNEVVKFTWVDDEGLVFSTKLTEAGIASGQWQGNTFNCQDHEGDDVSVELFTLHSLTPADIKPELLTFNGYASELTHMLKEKGGAFALVDQTSDSYFILCGEEVCCIEKANGDDLLAPSALYSINNACCISPTAWEGDCWMGSTVKAMLDTLRKPIWVKLVFQKSAEELRKQIEVDIAVLRSKSNEPVSIALSKNVDIEIRPEDERVLVGRLDWGHTNVNYTSEGLVLDVFGNSDLEPLHTTSVFAEDLS